MPEIDLTCKIMDYFMIFLISKYIYMAFPGIFIF